MRLKNIALVTGLVVSGIAVNSVLNPANASVLYDSISNASSAGTDSVKILGPLANSFSTTGTAEKLTSVVLSLNKKNNPSGPGSSAQNGTATVNLLSDNNTNPGSLLQTIDSIADTSLSVNIANYSFTLATPYTLTANTRYWIQLSDGGNSAARWSYTVIFHFSCNGYSIAQYYQRSSKSTTRIKCKRRYKTCNCRDVGRYGSVQMTQSVD